MRSTSVTIPAANNPEIRAINKTWRVESLYIKLLPSRNSHCWGVVGMALRCFSTGDPLCFGFELGQSETTLKPEYLRLQDTTRLIWWARSVCKNVGKWRK